MRSAGVGMLLIGALLVIGVLIAAEDPAAALAWILAGGFLFVAGSVFAVGAELREAIRRAN